LKVKQQSRMVEKSAPRLQIDQEISVASSAVTSIPAPPRFAKPVEEAKAASRAHPAET
jgi:hypothetical protein